MYKAIIAIVIATIVVIFAFTQIDPKILMIHKLVLLKGIIIPSLSVER